MSPRDNSLRSTATLNLTSHLPYCQMKTQYLINFSDILSPDSWCLMKEEGRHPYLYLLLSPVSCGGDMLQMLCDSTYCYTEHNRNLQTYICLVSSFISTMTTQGFKINEIEDHSFISRLIFCIIFSG